MTASAYFSETYEQARRRFLGAAEAAGARLESYENRNASGPGGM
ncbi:MAG: M14 family metallopeptidase, partial [Alphaproteobacteria bacterium]|nr:M14 family metallopeptidase [Alphaproteobacteria bacterium]MDX5416941.1 M14 family metallopeptidase [Alphaproteobacteria bacterium]MDX5494339.1 M14 family metallopeptidase [Alphaproteobacteria bacterium]